METLKTFKFEEGEKERFKNIIWLANQEILDKTRKSKISIDEMVNWMNIYAGLNLVGWMLCGDDVQEEDTIEESLKPHTEEWWDGKISKMLVERGFCYADRK